MHWSHGMLGTIDIESENEGHLGLTLSFVVKKIKVKRIVS